MLAPYLSRMLLYEHSAGGPAARDAASGISDRCILSLRNHDS